MSGESTSGSNVYLFITKDSDGEPVALKHATFSGKIIKDHPEITPNIIKEGVEYAHVVFKNPDDNNRRTYLRYILSPLKDRNNITNLKVVVEETSTGPAEIVTAYLPSKLKNEVVKGDLLYDAGSASKS